MLRPMKERYAGNLDKEIQLLPKCAQIPSSTRGNGNVWGFILFGLFAFIFNEGFPFVILVTIKSLNCINVTIPNVTPCLASQPLWVNIHSNQYVLIKEPSTLKSHRYNRKKG